MKFCIDCEHYRNYEYEHYCHRNRTERFSYIDKHTISVGDALTCDGQRYPNWFEKVFGDVCGPEGKYFVEKSE